MGYVKQVGYSGIVVWILFSAFIIWVNVVVFIRKEENKNFYKTSKLAVGLFSDVIGIGFGGTAFFFFVWKILNKTLKEKLFHDDTEVEVSQTRKRVVLQ